MTDTIMDWLQRVARVPADGKPGPPDICIIELGGTVGDIESMPYVEALRQFQFRIGRENIAFFHVSLVPVLGAVGEEKTKPTQHSVQNLRSVGLTPDFLVCRSSKAPRNPWNGCEGLRGAARVLGEEGVERRGCPVLDTPLYHARPCRNSAQPLSATTKEKLANFTHVPPENCLGVHDVSNIYRVPLLLQHQGAADNLLARLNLVRYSPRPTVARQLPASARQCPPGLLCSCLACLRNAR